MKPYQANLYNGIVLVLLGLFSYLISTSNTAIIPVIFGVIFLALTPIFRKGNKVVAHIIVVLTLLILIALFKPLTGAMERGDSMGIARIAIMMLSCFVAMVVYIKSFIDARKA